MPFYNSESHFAQVPSIDIQRSKMKIPYDHKTSFDFGRLVPLYVDSDILPGDTVRVTQSFVARLQTLLTPVMDDARLELAAFFVPHRLVWDNFKKMMGESDSPWIQGVQYAIPTISSPSGGFNTGTVADYMGLPIGVQWSNTDANAPSVLPLRSYAKIWNDFYRDTNLQYAINIDTTDANATGTNGTTYLTDSVCGGILLPVAKTHDYFTSGLPSAQRASQPVQFPLITGSMAPVVTTNQVALSGAITDAKSLVTWDTQGNASQGVSPTYKRLADSSGDVVLSSATNFNQASVYTTTGIRPANLWADLSSTVGSVTINALRLSFQLQKWYERAAVGGNRYTDLVRAMFSVVSPDARLQRAEFLGGTSVPIVINSVVNNSESANYKLGNLGAMSNTSDSSVLFEHSFTEHGTLMILAYARISSRTYSQGIHRQWLRRTKEDFYWPVFAHLGEQPIKVAEIYADGHMNDDDVFAYQEAWAEYRYRPNMCTGFMRPGISGSLASWHFGDYYQSQPYLSDAWIQEGVENVDRTLAVTTAAGTNQVFGEFFFDMEYTRPMPVYSIPGLIDHF